MGMDTPSEDRLRRRVLVAVGAATIIVSALVLRFANMMTYSTGNL